MAGTVSEQGDARWLNETTLEQLASIAETDPDKFVEQYSQLDIRRKLQVRRFLYERHKEGHPIPTALRAAGSSSTVLETPSDEETVLDVGETEEETVLEPAADEEASSLEGLFGGEAPADTDEEASEEVTSLDALLAGEEAPAEGEAPESGIAFEETADDGEATSLEDLFAMSSDEETTDVGEETELGEGEAFSLEDLFGGESEAVEEVEEEEETELEVEEEAAPAAASTEGGVDLPDDYGVPTPVEMTPEEIAEILKPLDLFEGLSDHDLQDLAAKMEAVRYESGALLCRDGDEGDAMWLIKEGGIRVLPQGQDIGVVLPPGTIVGEMSLLDGSPRSATLVTEGTTILLSYSLEGYQQTFRDAPDAGMAFLRNLLKLQQDRLRETTRKAAEEAAAKARAEGELKQAEHTQKLALPEGLPSFGDSEFAVTYTGARGVSGDYYDFIEFPDDPDKLIVIFGDSTGHGLNAGLLMLLAKAASFTQKKVDPSVPAITAAINDVICNVFEATLFMTFVCMLIDRKACTIEYTNAGQQSHPYLYRMKTGEFVPLESQTFQLGIQEGAEYISETISYEPGDLLVCYSDGIIEAPYCPEGATEVDRDQEFGDERLRRIIEEVKDKTPKEIIDRLLEEARAFCFFFDGHATINGVEWDGDDITNLVIRLR